ncbi:hypothetical protein [Chryseolinea soli]|uniref:Uncharacterized protein n=1 Tax=Chryseolinea soli TaxID=2321403 RepID=A0A385SNG3_9BACT|nr:hypothetical protein [Chryseolinea soli]AYB32046.1 hypothetical protein D4L85_16370 [Chryseolinea soli]
MAILFEYTFELLLWMNGVKPKYTLGEAVQFKDGVDTGAVMVVRAVVPRASNYFLRCQGWDEKTSAAFELIIDQDKVKAFSWRFVDRLHGTEKLG